MAITQPIFKISPPAFAWQQIQIILTDNDDNDDDNCKGLYFNDVIENPGGGGTQKG